MTQTTGKNKAVYPGTFDPVTNGHISLIERAAPLFDELIVAVSESSGKSPLFSLDERVELMRQVVGNLDLPTKVSVVGFKGLLAEFAKSHEVDAIIRGLRALSDFEYEFQMALMNRKLAHDIETVFMMPALSWVYLSSSLVKDIAMNSGDIQGLVPTVVQKAMKKKLSK